jgi:SAM-dependent methyltransferase
LVADAHYLPFVDQVFDGIVALNAFEHYAQPERVAAELLRLLKPDGWVLIQTAFLQPEHEAPWHFYNCTKQGLLRWFAAFSVEQLRVSDNLNPVYALSWLASDCEAALRQELGAAAADGFRSASLARLVDAWRDPARRQDPVWTTFSGLSQDRQEGIAAGFELIARKPTT